MKVRVGDEIYIPNETVPYEVQTRDERYIICTNSEGYYFIVDLVEKWRAPDDIVFCSGYETQEDCMDRLRELQRGEIGLSRRRGVPLDVDVE